MFELMMKVCVGLTFCHYTVPPLAYDSLSACQTQAGLIAGLQAGQHAPGRDVTITYRCRLQGTARGEASTWFAVSLLGSPAEELAR